MCRKGIWIRRCISAYPMKWGLRGVWHCYSLLWFPHTPPLWRHSGVGHFDSNSDTMRSKTVLQTTLYSACLFHWFRLNCSTNFDPKIHQKSIADRYYSQTWFRSRFLLPPESKCVREEQKPLKHMDYRSKIDLAHFRTYGQVASWCSSISLPKSIQQSSIFGPENISATDSIL